MSGELANGKTTKLELSPNSIILQNILKDSTLDESEVERDVDVPEEYTIKCDAIIAEGMNYGFAFKPERLMAHRDEVKALIQEIAIDPFFLGKGDGASVIHLRRDRQGNSWGTDYCIEILICLALGMDLARWCVPRNHWHLLPHSMPMVAFNLDGEWPAKDSSKQDS